MMMVDPEIIKDNGKTLTLEVVCVSCGEPKQFEVDAYGYSRRLEGELIHKCFPTMDPATRELMISGICGECWDEMFKEEPD